MNTYMVLIRHGGLLITKEEQTLYKGDDYIVFSMPSTLQYQSSLEITDELLKIEIFSNYIIMKYLYNESIVHPVITIKKDCDVKTFIIFHANGSSNLPVLYVTIDSTPRSILIEKCNPSLAIVTIVHPVIFNGQN